MKTRRYLFTILALAALAGLTGRPPNAYHALALAVSPPGSGVVVAQPALPDYLPGTA